jgi:hypothetical protein
VSSSFTAAAGFTDYRDTFHIGGFPRALTVWLSVVMLMLSWSGVHFQARGAPFPMSARKLIPVADKLAADLRDAKALLDGLSR